MGSVVSNPSDLFIALAVPVCIPTQRIEPGLGPWGTKYGSLELGFRYTDIDMGNKSEVREFLISCRKKVESPQVGLPTGQNRRVPWLRRIEVANPKPATPARPVDLFGTMRNGCAFDVYLRHYPEPDHYLTGRGSARPYTGQRKLSARDQRSAFTDPAQHVAAADRPGNYTKSDP